MHDKDVKASSSLVDKKLNKVGRKKKSRLYEVVETDATVDSMGLWTWMFNKLLVFRLR